MVRSDNSCSTQNSLAFLQRRLQVLSNFLINSGISTKKLVRAGFSRTNTITPIFFDKDRRLNQRVDFRLIN